MKNTKKHLRMYHLLLKLFYPKKGAAEVYRPELLRISVNGGAKVYHLAGG